MSQLRITGGRWRGRKIRTAPETRPTQDRVREALCSRWQMRIEGAILLELFSGSGAVAIELLSRGAQSAHLVDSADQSLRSARANFELFEVVPQSHRCSLPEGLGKLPGGWPISFSLIFADPPYGFGELETVVTRCLEKLSPDGELALEHSYRDRLDLPKSISPVDQRRYGETMVSFFRH